MVTLAKKKIKNDFSSLVPCLIRWFHLLCQDFNHIVGYQDQQLVTHKQKKDPCDWSLLPLTNLHSFISCIKRLYWSLGHHIFGLELMVVLYYRFICRFIHWLITKSMKHHKEGHNSLEHNVMSTFVVLYCPTNCPELKDFHVKVCI